MAKFYGIIGYAELEETSPGVHTEKIIERNYYGEVNRNTRRLESSGNLNDNINIANEISIVADPYAMNHFHAMRYVVLHDAKWKISNVDEKYPRLILTVGGLYNGQ